MLKRAYLVLVFYLIREITDKGSQEEHSRSLITATETRRLAGALREVSTLRPWGSTGQHLLEQT